MSANNPNHKKYPQRKRLRLKNYDYSRAGLYFITICIDRLKNPGMMPFGHVKNGQMILNDAGKMVEKWYWELENKYPDKQCHEMVVMPNHIHFIIENMPANGVIGDGGGKTAGHAAGEMANPVDTVNHAAGEMANHADPADHVAGETANPARAVDRFTNAVVNPNHTARTIKNSMPPSTWPWGGLSP